MEISIASTKCSVNSSDVYLAIIGGQCFRQLPSLGRYSQHPDESRALVVESLALNHILNYPQACDMQSRDYFVQNR